MVRPLTERGCGGGREFEERIEQQLDAEVVDRAAEENRRQLAGQHRRRGRNAAPAPSSIASSSTVRA